MEFGEIIKREEEKLRKGRKVDIQYFDVLFTPNRDLLDHHSIFESLKQNIPLLEDKTLGNFLEPPNNETSSNIEDIVTFAMRIKATEITYSVQETKENMSIPLHSQ